MERSADPAARWVKQMAPNDDYVPPVEVEDSIEQLPIARTPIEASALEAFATDEGLTIGESWEFGRTWRWKPLASDGKIATALGRLFCRQDEIIR